MHATTPEFSMYKSVENKNFKNQSINDNRKFGKLIAVSGFCVYLVGVVQVLSATQKAPTFDITNPAEYEKSLKKWQTNQKNYKIASAALFTVSGICLLFAADDLLSHKVTENKTTSLNIKASPSSVGLCLNFK